MKITKKEYRESSTSEALKSLIVKEDCLEVDLCRLPSVRQLINIITKSTGKKYTTKSYKNEGIGRIWRIK